MSSEDYEIFEMMEGIVDDIQKKEIDNEENGEIFMNFMKKFAERSWKRRSRKASVIGIVRPKGQWKFSGIVHGKLEVLKSKTYWHHCGQFNYWKRGCPIKRNIKVSAGKEERIRNLCEIPGNDDKSLIK